MSKLTVIMGNQLYPQEHLPDPSTATVLMVEDKRLCGRHRYHQQKLGFVIGAMREYAASLEQAASSG